jgi:hypothetical protein
MSPFRTFIMFVLVSAGLVAAVGAREANWWSYRDLEQKSDLIVIAKPVEFRHLDEPVELPGLTSTVLGVETRFVVLAVLKGKRETKDFILHHYRLRSDGPVWNPPDFKRFEPKGCEQFLLFLAERSDGQFEAVAGQMDLSFSVKSLGCL